MKSFGLFTIAAAVLAMTVAACTIDDTVTAPAFAANGGRMSMSIDGTGWSADVSVTARRSGDRIVVVGTRSGGARETLSITIVNAKNAGAIDVSDDPPGTSPPSIPAACAIFTRSDPRHPSSSTGYATPERAGSLTITRITSDRIEGAFAFRLSAASVARATITGGSFSAPFE